MKITDSNGNLENAATPNQWHIVREAKNPTPIRFLLCLDPGETTGWAAFTNGRLSESGQLDSTSDTANGLHTLLHHRFAGKPDHLVAEDYRVYAHRVLQHTNSSLFTPRLLGMIEAESELNAIPLTLQMATQAKGFVSDQRLKDWGMWTTQRHARDAIRHGIYFLLFDSNARSRT